MSSSVVSSHCSSQLRRMRTVPLPARRLHRGPVPRARHRSKVRREIFSSAQTSSTVSH
jgi:hypothetical protein